MKHSRSSTFLLLLIAWLTAGAAPVLRNLDIRVLLSKNGDARITEVRQMAIDSEGTECYIGLATMGSSEVKDLEVSDETGRVYANIGSWDVDQSRSWKEGKCGIEGIGVGEYDQNLRPHDFLGGK